MGQTDLERRIEVLDRLMRERMGLLAPDFAGKVRKAGRRLPRGIRRQAQDLASAAQLARHPRLSFQSDPERLVRAAEQVEGFLRDVDPTERQRMRLLDLAGTMAINLLLLVALVIAVLAWRGLIGPAP